MEPKYLSGVVTQGEGAENRWVTQYEVYMSVDGENFYPYSERQDGEPTTFKANNDSSTPVANYFMKNILARYIRLKPSGNHNGTAMR